MWERRPGWLLVLIATTESALITGGKPIWTVLSADADSISGWRCASSIVTILESASSGNEWLLFWVFNQASIIKYHYAFPCSDWVWPNLPSLIRSNHKNNDFPHNSPFVICPKLILKSFLAASLSEWIDIWPVISLLKKWIFPEWVECDDRQGNSHCNLSYFTIPW